MPANVVPDQAISKPENPGPGAPLTEWKLYHDQMSLFLQWQIDVEEWRGSIDNRVGHLETITSRILKQIGPPRITIEQQNLIYYYVSRLNQATGKYQQTLFAALKTRFQVPRYDEISASEWPNVESWFKQQFPGHQLPPTQEHLFE